MFVSPIIVYTMQAVKSRSLCLKNLICLKKTVNISWGSVNGSLDKQVLRNRRDGWATCVCGIFNTLHYHTLDHWRSFVCRKNNAKTHGKRDNIFNHAVYVFQPSIIKKEKRKAKQPITIKAKANANIGIIIILF